MGNLSNILAKRLGDHERVVVRELSDEQKEINKKYEEKVSNYSNKPQPKPVPTYNILKKMWWHYAKELSNNVGKELIIDDENENFIKSILYYFTEDQEQFKKHSSCMIQNEPDINKGLFIAGSYGFGKSLSMIAMRKALQGFKGSFAYKSTVEIVAELDQNSKVDYTRGTYFFDDLGQEKKHYGREVFADLLFQRYDLFRNKSKKTHITSNMGMHQIKERYGEYINSRFFEMFNIIYVTGKDRRK